MNAAILAAIGLTGIVLGYRFYSKFIGEKIYQLDPDFVTPAHAQRDDIDYLPQTVSSSGGTTSPPSPAPRRSSGQASP